MSIERYRQFIASDARTGQLCLDRRSVLTQIAEAARQVRRSTDDKAGELEVGEVRVAFGRKGNTDNLVSAFLGMITGKYGHVVAGEYPVLMESLVEATDDVDSQVMRSKGGLQ